MLTPLGARIYPLLKQCYESAMSARSLATMINDGEVGVLKIAVSNSVDLGLIMSHVSELKKHLSDLELKIMRGPGLQVAEYLKSGDAELAVAAAIGDAWDRLDRWALFEESFDLAFSRAALVLLMDRTLIRIGDPVYTAENRSFGATTLLSRHLRVENGEVRLKFVAKGGRKVLNARRAKGRAKLTVVANNHVKQIDWNAVYSPAKSKRGTAGSK